MKNIFLTLDLEEWFHLDYLRNYNIKRQITTINQLSDFFSILDTYDIKITIFVLGELIEEHEELLKELSQKGHELAIHGWDHELLYNKTDEDFVSDLRATKTKLEELSNRKVFGYRAPCFSIDNQKFNMLEEIGLNYDSSYIKFKEHPLYGKLNMKEFIKIEDLIYKKGNVFEMEIPTLSIFNFNIPISGGGYFRLFPKHVFQLLWNKYIKKSSNYIMYLHPFELADIQISTKNFSTFDRFRFSVGRKSNLKKLEWFIKKCKQEEIKFFTISQYLNQIKD